MTPHEESAPPSVNAMGEDRYEIAAVERFDCTPEELWTLLCDWERFVEVGLPGMTSAFRWLSGGPRHAPSRFEFTIAGAVLKEEIYELSADLPGQRYRARYRALEPALGVLEYDAVLDARPGDGPGTVLETVREVRLMPGSPPDLLVGMIAGEMQSLKAHFAGGA
ncbi:MAG: hypothetical protein R3E98_20920 [Gemmatimonadota bacterium]